MKIMWYHQDRLTVRRKELKLKLKKRKKVFNVILLLVNKNILILHYNLV